MLCKPAAPLFGPLPTSNFDTTSSATRLSFILLRKIPRVGMDALERFIHFPLYKPSFTQIPLMVCQRF